MSATAALALGAAAVCLAILTVLTILPGDRAIAAALAAAHGRRRGEIVTTAALLRDLRGLRQIRHALDLFNSAIQRAHTRHCAQISRQKSLVTYRGISSGLVAAATVLVTVELTILHTLEEAQSHGIIRTAPLSAIATASLAILTAGLAVLAITARLLPRSLARILTVLAGPATTRGFPRSHFY